MEEEKDKRDYIFGKLQLGFGWDNRYSSLLLVDGEHDYFWLKFPSYPKDPLINWEEYEYGLLN